jgi:hypothetical protein
VALKIVYTWWFLASQTWSRSQDTCQFSNDSTGHDNQCSTESNRYHLPLSTLLSKVLDHHCGSFIPLVLNWIGPRFPKCEHHIVAFHLGISQGGYTSAIHWIPQIPPFTLFRVRNQWSVHCFLTPQNLRHWDPMLYFLSKTPNPSSALEGAIFNALMAFLSALFLWLWGALPLPIFCLFYIFLINKTEKKSSVDTVAQPTQSLYHIEYIMILIPQLD